MSGNGLRWALQPDPLWEIERHAKRLAYLGKPDRILAHLAQEYGTNRAFPSVAKLQSFIDEYNRPMPVPRLERGFQPISPVEERYVQDMALGCQVMAKMMLRERANDR